MYWSASIEDLTLIVQNEQILGLLDSFRSLAQNGTAEAI